MMESDFCAASTAFAGLVRLPWSSPSVINTSALRPTSVRIFSLEASQTASYTATVPRPAEGTVVGVMPPPTPAFMRMFAQRFFQQRAGIGEVLQQLRLDAQN